MKTHRTTKRVMVMLADDQVSALDAIADKHADKRSRLIREAIDGFLKERGQPLPTATPPTIGAR